MSELATGGRRQLGSPTPSVVPPRRRRLRLLLTASALILLGGTWCFTSRNDRTHRVGLLPDLKLATFVPADPFDTVRRPFMLDDASGTASIRAAGTLVVPIRPIDGSSTLEFELRFVRRGNRAASGTLQIGRLGLDGRQQTLRSVKPADASEWTLQRINVRPPLPFLYFEATLGGPTRVEFRSVRLQVLGDDGDQPTGSARSAPDGADRPNILIVILDAARAANFGAHGYARDTTPYIDQLAATGFVFRSAFSECPNTSCSIPNLISGLPFIEIGRRNTDRRLDDRVTTLAESLGALGYWTIGISASPFNSVARNSSQGFAEFHEMWTWPGNARQHPDRHDPHRLSQRAIDALRAAPADQPVLMQLHYVPPHEPYHPRPEFDLFGDPEYDGVMTPGFMLGPVRNGEVTFGEADVEAMVAMYDGNLRMADDAVEMVFEAFRNEGRWENTVVLVTSDHGEAFFEHGQQGHNSSMYDEMLHIPFILRLPADARTEVDANRLVTLSDVTPTLLGLVGLEPEPGVSGIDLLNTLPDPNRAIFLRRGTGGFAVRTMQWKAVYSSKPGESAMFDLRADPAERHDVLHEERLLYRAFETLLTRHQAAVAALNLTSEAIELSGADRDMLRSLGYVR